MSSFFSSLISGLGSAAGSSTGNFLSDLFTWFGSNNRNQNALNRNLQRQALQMQSDQYAESLQHDVNMVQENKGAQMELMRLQNELNSPETLVKQLMAAGISPSAVFGKQSPLGNTSPASSHGSVVGSSASIPSGSSIPFQSAFAQAGSSVAELMNALGNYRLNNAEADKVAALLPQMVEKGIVDIEQVKLQNDTIALENYVKDKVKDTKVQQEIWNLLNTQQDLMVKQALEDYYVNSSDLLEVQKRVMEITEKTNDFQLKYLLNTAYRQFNEFMKNLRSQTASNYASANQSNANADYLRSLKQTEDEIREWKVLTSKYGGLINKSNFAVLNATEQQRMRKIVNEALASDYLPQHVAQDLRRAEKENDWFEVNQIMNIVSTAIDAYGAYATGGMVRVGEVRNKINEEWNDYHMRNYKYDEHYTFEKNGRHYDAYRSGFVPYGSLGY